MGENVCIIMERKILRQIFGPVKDTLKKENSIKITISKIE